MATNTNKIMKLEQLIEKLEKLTNKKVILKEFNFKQSHSLHMKYDKNYDGRFEIKEGKTISPWEVRPGDILEVPRYGKLVAVSYGDKGRTLTKIDIVHLSSVDSTIEKGGIFKMATLTSRLNATYEIVGKLDPKKLQALRDIADGTYKKQAERATKNFSQTDYDSQRGEYYVNLVNGKKAYRGDKVTVKFDNGNFTMTIKAVAGNKDGKVTVIQSNREKGRTVSPERILDVISSYKLGS